MRPKISVCMATCDGEAYIREQLASVLPQLEPQDEVIVVDDASEDATKTLIAAFQDRRIRLIEHRVRQGVVKTFEHGVRSAGGEIVFLSDQDDLWAPQKVSRVMSVFLADPEVMVVATGVQTIDKNGREVDDRIYSRPRPFSSALVANLVANRFQGSTMAFRAALIPAVVPFPEGFHVLHDAWIGLRNTVTGGKTFYIDEPLLLYRRHSENASRRLSPIQQILKRGRLVTALALRWGGDKLRNER